MSPRACPECLRRNRLLGLLAPYIEKIATSKGGTRSPQLLGLPVADLVERVANKNAPVAVGPAAARAQPVMAAGGVPA